MTVPALITAAAEHSEHNVMAETFVFGLIAMGIFTLLGLVTLSYRNVSNRHSRKAAAYAQAHANDVERHGHGH